MDKQREQFEAWAEERGHDTECWPGEMIYKDHRTGNLWAAYKFGKEQAAQAAPGEAVAWIPIEAIQMLKKSPLLVLRNVPLLTYSGEGHVPLYTRPTDAAAVEREAAIDRMLAEHTERVATGKAEAGTSAILLVKELRALRNPPEQKEGE